MPDTSLAAIESPPKDNGPYLGGSRGRAVAALVQGLHEGEGPLLLTGPAGVGKSFVLQAALATLADEPIRVIRLSHPETRPWSHRDLARQILGGPIEASTDIAVAKAIAELTSAAANEGQVIIAVDDAQTLTDKALQLLLLIASPVRGGRIPPRLVLAGRDDFWDGEQRSDLRLITGLAERVTLEALSGTEARDYVLFRLRQLGGPDDGAIGAEALDAIFRHSDGLPGQIDRILIAATSQGVHWGGGALTGEAVEAAIASIEARPSLSATDSNAARVAVRPDSPAPDAVVPPPAMVEARPVADSDAAQKPRLRVVSASVTSGQAAIAKQDAAMPAPQAAIMAPASALAVVITPKRHTLWPAAGKNEEASKALPRDIVKPPAAVTRITPRQMQAAGAFVAVAILVTAIGGFVLSRGKPGVQPSTTAGLSVPPGLSPDQATPSPVSPNDRSPAEPAVTAEHNGGAIPAAGPADTTTVRQGKPDGPEQSARPSSTNPAAVETVVPTTPPGADKITAVEGTDGGSAVTAGHETKPLSPAPVAVAKDPIPPVASLDSTAPPDSTPAVSTPVRPPSPENGGTATAPIVQPGAGGSPETSPAAAGETHWPVAADTAGTNGPASAGSTSGNVPGPREPRVSRTDRAPEAGPVSALPPSAGIPAASSLPANTSGAPSMDEPRPSGPVIALGGTLPSAPPQVSARPELVTILLRRGDTMLEEGDVVAARLFYERAAAAGSGEGATSAGKTYDPNFLANIHARGLTGDPARAIEWYRIASTLYGDKEAAERLKVLTAQAGQ